MSEPVTPRVVLVTSRTRLVASLGLPAAAWPEALTAQIRGAIEGGVDLVQVREPDVPSGLLVQFLRRLFQNVPLSRNLIVINDRADVALAVGARGVHLPERSMGVGDAVRLGGATGWVVGRSVHGPGEAARSHDASYLMAGSVEASASHPGGARLGWPGLRRVVDAASGVPVVAIGGLTQASAAQVRASGAAGLAAVGWFVPPEGVTDVAGFVQDRVAELRMVFDSQASVSYTREAAR